MNDLLQQLKERGRSKRAYDLVVTAEEVAEWPDGTLARLLNDGVLEEIQPAKSVTCDACEEGHAESVQVVDQPPGSELRHYIACPEIGMVAVDPARMRQWEIRSVGLGERDPVEDLSLGATETPESLWPLTAAAFAAILRQANRSDARTLRWYEIKERLAALEHYPHRVRDVRRNVLNWDEVVESPRRGFYRLKAQP